MPNISAHMIVGREVAKRLKIESKEFFKGNLLPDIIDCDDSHHRIQNGVYLVPDISFFLKELDLTDDLWKGYLVHLLLDKYYLEIYLGKKFKDKNVFIDGEIYNDYDYINKTLVKNFNLDINFFDEVLTDYKQKILEERLLYNKECLMQSKIGVLKYLDYESFSQFLIRISQVISQELSEYVAASYKKENTQKEMKIYNERIELI